MLLLRELIGKNCVQEFGNIPIKLKRCTLQPGNSTFMYDTSEKLLKSYAGIFTAVYFQEV